DWLVAASIKEAVLETPLRRALYLLYGFGALVLLAMSGVALWLWRFVERPLEGLAVASGRVGAMEAPPPIRTSLREFAAVRDALAAAAERVRANSEQLETRVAARTQELAAANEALRAQMAAREKAEEQLRQAQKMEAVGQLTGGIAHDFNNLLTVVLGSFERIRRDLGRGRTPAEIENSIDNGIQASQRAAALTRSLLAFSRRQPLEPHPVDINRLVSRLSDLLRRTIGEQITIESVNAGGLWRTYVDPNQLESAILNLSVNARDAMPGGGKLTVETANAYLDEHSLAGESDAAPGQYVMVCITDTGTGMSPEVRAKAFEPFFTTKGVGQGTGLGLSQVYGFVKQSGGHIQIYSEPGEGTAVKIYLPRLADEAAAVEPVPHVPPAAEAARGERILVVEDEDGVRERTVEILTELGYGVIEAATGPAALALLDGGAVADLLFTDVGLPGGMNGRQLANEAQARRPGLKVLFTTGYARNAIVHDGRLDPGVSLVTKPFTAAELARAVRGVLDAQSRRPTILVVEDDVLIRMGTVAMLEDLGFLVEEAGTAAEAMDKLRRLDGQFAATVLDLGLPDRSGDSLAGEVRAIDAAMPIVIASGYVNDALSRRFAGDARIRFLGKPFQPEQLAEALAGFGIRAATVRA
ncbi:MAG: response regulator, partial [Rhodospirillales bacterium]